MTYEEFLQEWRDNGPAIKAFTSGSTGHPKHIALPREFVRKSGQRTNEFFGIDCHSHLHSCISPDFIGGKMMAVRSELSGARLTWEEPSNRPLKGLSQDDELTLVAVVPSQVHHILDNLPKLPKIGNLLIGGSAIPSGLRKRIADSRVSAYESYGMTETASHIALRKVAADEGWFELLPGINISKDERGCLLIRFDSGEEMVTNDIVEIKEGDKFRILGRVDNVIITGGKKVHPEDVEARLSRLISGSLLLSSEPDEKWGERLVLYVESDAPEDEETLLEEMHLVLEKWEQPKEIKWGMTLPRTPNGKIKRKG